MAIYTVQNRAASTRIFYDARKQEVKIEPGCMRHVEIDDRTYAQLAMRGDLVMQRAVFTRHAPQQQAAAAVPVPTDAPATRLPLVVTGHFGIGDNLHQRAVMRELMKTHEVWLHTCHFNLYRDLVEQGLHLVMRPTGLHAQARTIARESELFAAAGAPAAPRSAVQRRIGYPKTLVDQHGSILEAMFSCVDLRMPARPDFSLPIDPEWRRALREKYVGQWSADGKPLMVHRPVVVRREWDGRSRNPDPAAYDQLYRSIRERYFVVSVADLAPDREWIDGPHQEVDVKLHAGELSFPEMAALWAEADLVFCNAGFAPVLAQAVGTPVIVVYGGRESYRTTQRVGAHLAATLPIDPIRPCDCHSASHRCDKQIDVPRALESVRAFTEQRDTLLFGTFYVDSPDRSNLTDLWKRLHLTLNEGCDFLAVDSASPIKKFEDWTPFDGQRHRRMIFDFGDNVGHLSRPRTTPGRDGWGRAFCKGLEIACELGYEYVAHVEGDSLLRLRVADVTKWMRREGADCASTDVRGMRIAGSELDWIETGLMFFSTDYLRRSNFVGRYDWPRRQASPTPERFIRTQILSRDLDARQLRIMPWKVLRADKNQITKDNIAGLDLDWVTHQHNSAQQEVYSTFVEMALSEQKEVMPVGTADRLLVALPQSGLRLNLGCGTNRLAGWENRDADVDITKRLPWGDGVASHISIEHCVEHVPYKAAIEFFREAHRVLAPGGVLRVTVPSLEQIAKCEDPEYHRFTAKWQPLGASKRGAMHAIIYAHGHETAWNAQLMSDTLYFAGFDDVTQCETGQSDDPVLRGVEGHGRVIGDKFNRVESCTHEARKSGQAPAEQDAEEIAVVIGGAECWRQDLDDALRLVGGRRVRYFYINDQIKSFPERGVACTLHPDKLNGHFAWLQIRRKAGLPEPEQVWSNRRHGAVTHDTASKDWTGSSGLFAVQIALREGHRKVLACGVPMTVDAGHFERHQKWQSAIAFRQGWINCKVELKHCFRSMSGWTAEQFGKPDEEWLNAK